LCSTLVHCLIETARNLFQYRQINPFYVLSSYLLKILLFIIIIFIPSASRSSKWSLSFVFSYHIVYCTLTEVFLTLTEVFPCFFLSCKANARVKFAKTGHGPHSSTLFVICVVLLLFVLFYVLFVCKCVLPPGDNPTAVNKYINQNFHMNFSSFRSCHIFFPPHSS